MDVGLTPAASSSCCCCYSGPGALLPPTPRSKGILNPGDPEAKRSRIGSDSGDPLAKSSETPGGLNPDGSSAKSLSTALEGMAWIKEVLRVLGQMDAENLRDLVFQQYRGDENPAKRQWSGLRSHVLAAASEKEKGGEVVR